MQELANGQYSGNILRRAEHDGLICCHTSYLCERFNSERHYHKNAHFSFVITGYCTEKKKVETVRGPGHITFYHAGEAHQVTAVSKDSRHINVEIDAGLLKRYEITEAAIESALARPDTRFGMLRLYQGMQLGRVNEMGETFMQLVTGDLPLIKPAWIFLVEEFLRDHIGRPVSLAHLANVAGVHPVTISRYFPRFFGCTLSAYQRKLQIGKAMELMRSGRLSLTDIAFHCGFADQSHFTRTFRELTGLRPGDYRAL
ncbi:helix-turn-helix transcriptional regulator [Mucilaginibacter aquariorum]|uniref:AraC family transcriptional regulator n=1 Tax=Mucilaginibacter aquariorum TaxID=2967225 RepID=A0ABT1SY18_9SPHI|nr:AraC family transcriptional regulator [Mucilaginibacter aquariorum]MCQ6957157.1 AraC family transcriptional regulator [Mucilaginibacter aquariorum]